MITVASSGTQTATIGTRHLIYDSSVSAVFTFLADLSAMALGDQVELEIEIAYAPSGATKKTYSSGLYAHVQSEPGKLSVPVPSPYQIKFFLTQSAGTGRAFPWAIIAA